MKIVTVVGARPQFIKAAAVSRELRKENEEVLVHTGQHYDGNMSDIFFEEMRIPRPEYHLGIGSGSHAKQTGEMLIAVEKILQKEAPDYLLVYGDTNSTLAGALAASKILIPVIHVEAGLRSFNKAMPEEQNRILTDHISTLLFCPTETAVSHLKREGITQGVHLVGDCMCDAVLYYTKEMEHFPENYFWDRLEGIFGEVQRPDNWYLATIHRAENTDRIDKVEEILSAFEELDAPVLFPVHPRTKPFIKKLQDRNQYKNIIFTEPVGYLDMLYFTRGAKKAVTDSGGLQKEAYILETDTVTVRDQTEWVETLAGNHNILCKPQKSDILEKVYCREIAAGDRPPLYGDGHSARKICEVIRGE